MHKRLVFALLLAFLLEPAMAASPAMDAAFPVSANEPFYPDPDGMLQSICDLCGLSFDYCTHVTNVMGHSPHRALTFTPETFTSHPEWPRDAALPVLDPSPEPEPEPEPSDSELQLPPVHYDHSSPLYGSIVEQLDDNATSMLPSTIAFHVGLTYNPGDRLTAQARRRNPQKRMPPRPGGFPCLSDGCERIFNRVCDLNRHQKTHLERNERPHKCLYCDKAFLYPKDRFRHQQTHGHVSSSQTFFYCPVSGCNANGFSRHDNLLRHQRKQHSRLIQGS